MSFDTMVPIPNKLLNSDGSVTTFSGEEILAADPVRAELYKTMHPIANKLLNPDGSIGTLDSLGGGAGGGGPPGASDYNLLTGRPQVNGVTLSGNKTPEDLKLSYSHTQNTAATVWTIPHNLGFQRVSVEVIDNAGNFVIPEIEYASANIVILTFANPVQGVAVVRR